MLRPFVPLGFPWIEYAPALPKLRPRTSEIGPKPKCRDVRYLVAIGWKADTTRTLQEWSVDRNRSSLLAGLPTMPLFKNSAQRADLLIATFQ